MLCNKCRMLVCVVALAALMLFGSIQAANADITSYSSYDAFSAAIDPVGRIDVTFDEITAEMNFCTADGYQKDGVKVVNTNDANYYLWGEPGGGTDPYGTGYLFGITSSNLTNVNTVSLPTGKKAVGMYIADDYGSVDVTVNDGATHTFQNIAATKAAPGFVGFVSGNDILSVSIVTDKVTVPPSASYLYLDHVIAGNPLPEPASILLLTTGIIGLLAYAWRKRK
jgi:hypothetical protein